MAPSHCVQYNVSNYARSKSLLWRALMDRGANGCILGKDVRVVHKTGQFIDLNGIDNHTVQNLQLVTGAAYIRTDHGPIIGLFHQSAAMRDGKTILSPVKWNTLGVKSLTRHLLSQAETPSLSLPMVSESLWLSTLGYPMSSLDLPLTLNSMTPVFPTLTSQVLTPGTPSVWTPFPLKTGMSPKPTPCW